jgi:glutaminyl-tRNA synthetase
MTNPRETDVDPSLPDAPSDFIRTRVADDVRAGKNGGKVVTRFPPEPNGYLHIGHAKSICLNFGVAEEFGGQCFLRFDDTNPTTEEEEFVESIKRDVAWLGFDWGDRLRFASDYFQEIYDYAEKLVRDGKAYVDSSTAEQIREMRGVPGQDGKNSPHRERSVEENLDLFRRMRAGEFDDGAHVLRAKIDMTSGNFNLRDPTLYRIRRAHHHRTGDAWCIYPMYDYTHPLSDSIEGTTHSLCTLEFEDHRPLYDWVLDAGGADPHPQQIEFARLNLDYTLMSKRKLKELVEEKRVSGWNDPRMPTLSGLRRRGVTPEAIRKFCERIGVAKNDSSVDIALFEHTIREDLDARAKRAMCVLKPLKVVIETLPDAEVFELDAPYHPTDASFGSRKLPLTRVVYIEESDFMLDPPKKFFRLGPGREVRLRYGPIIKCEEVVTNDAGEVVELRCSHDPKTLGPDAEPRKIKGIVHWVSATHGLRCEVRLYDRLFVVPNPSADKEGRDYRELINPESLVTLRDSVAEPSLAGASPSDRFQFERTGYFVLDEEDSRADALVWNRTVGLRDSWAKIEKSG